MITATYEAIDGTTRRRQFKTEAGARAFIVKWLGGSPDIGNGYLVSDDGIGTVTLEGASIAAVMAPTIESAPVPEWVCNAGTEAEFCTNRPWVGDTATGDFAKCGPCDTAMKSQHAMEKRGELAMDEAFLGWR